MRATLSRSKQIEMRLPGSLKKPCFGVQSKVSIRVMVSRPRRYPEEGGATATEGIVD